MHRFTMLCHLVTWTWALPVEAALVSIPLTGLVGEYPYEAGDSPYRTVEYDLGIAFERIDGVRIHLAGSLISGEYGIWDPWPPIPPGTPPPEPSAYADWWTGFTIFVREIEPGPSFTALATHPDPEGGAIDDRWALVPFYHDEGFDVLASGSGMVMVSLLPRAIPWPSVIVSEPSGDITSATLIIDGVLVPEPASMALLALGGLALLGRPSRCRPSPR